MEIDLIRLDGTKSFLFVEPSTSPPWTIKASGEGVGEAEFNGDTLFDALTNLRLHIETQGGKLICAGARRDVYPSGMARSMGSARRAYIMETGQSANVLVDIFDVAEPESVGTVAEQLRYREEWFASLRAKLK